MAPARRDEEAAVELSPVGLGAIAVLVLLAATVPAVVVAVLLGRRLNALPPAAPATRNSGTARSTTSTSTASTSTKSASNAAPTPATTTDPAPTEGADADSSEATDVLPDTEDDPTADDVDDDAVLAADEPPSAEAERLLRGARSEADRVLRGARTEADRLLERARTEARALAERAERRAGVEATEVLAEARRVGEQESERLSSSARELKDEVERRELRLAEREERLDAEHHRVEQRDRDLADAEAALGRRTEELAAREAVLTDAEAAIADAANAQAERLTAELERVAGLSTDAAKAELVKQVETQAKREAAILVRDLEAEAKELGEQRARQIVVDAVQRVASEQTAESVVSVLHLPGDEMKGRIIGREGRNIRAYESVTGVNLIIDDTPEAVLLSCFDPVRREVGRLTLEKLVLDGRIHPHRIEEVYEQSKAEVDQLCERAGEEALVKVGITDIHPELVTLLGRLRYRTSYGQNVLKHLIETAHIAGIMAAELGIEPTVIKRGAFLHDIGKALTHEVEGSHALIGADLARRYGESEDVVHAIEAHHNEVPPRTIEAVLTQASDSCSGGRPGARRESLEAYVTRLQRIEEIAGAKPGVDRVFAMQAGREVRVMVRPDYVDDLAAQILARDVARQIEDELTYPGQIRVTVVRESRASEVAR
jgi:ribonuclease Y